jgi:L-alanine-DL-glutamate epimerase-like enolase superfamily enzyme
MTPPASRSPTGEAPGWVFVAMDTDEGITGYGECPNSPRKGNVLAAKTVETVKASIIGQDPERTQPGTYARP